MSDKEYRQDVARMCRALGFAPGVLTEQAAGSVYFEALLTVGNNGDLCRMFPCDEEANDPEPTWSRPLSIEHYEAFLRDLDPAESSGSGSSGSPMSTSSASPSWRATDAVRRLFILCTRR